ncbi:MAG TPA: extracellular solute-binding protein [Roseiflexaceae bacterium]|nr:extracellular solute-binding protein [Roseiflexaceae bacterium]
MLNRRRFLQLLVASAGGAILAACGAPNPAAEESSTNTGGATSAPAAESAATSAPAAESGATSAPAESGATSAPAASGGTTKLTVMYQQNELSDDEVKQFMDKNPGITVERIDNDATKFKAMLTAGTPPDLFRTQGPVVPNLVERGIVLDLGDYFNSSSALKVDDLAPANNLYVYKGGRYGMVKDWSPDFNLFANKAAFEEANVPLPSTTEPLRYTDLSELAKQLTKREGDRTTRMGWGNPEGLTMVRTLQIVLAEQDQNLYKPDFTAIALAETSQAVAFLKYVFDLAKENVIWNPLNPSPSWAGDDFVKGQVGFVQYGYWYSGMVSTTKDAAVGGDKAVFLPAPTWSGKQLNPTISGTGMVAAKATKNPDAAWKFFEYYMSGAPAQTRAKSGWGVPALKSLYPQMPQETDFQKQVQQVLQESFKYADYTLAANPYYDDTVFDTSWTSNLEQALRGSISFDQLIQNVESDVNAAIADGKAAIG